MTDKNNENNGKMKIIIYVTAAVLAFILAFGIAFAVTSGFLAGDAPDTSDGGEENNGGGNENDSIIDNIDPDGWTPID